MMQKNYVNHEGWQLTFSMIDSKHAEIVKGEPVRKLFSLSSRSANTLLIPREIKGHTVTKIGEEAFRLPPDKTPCEVIFPDTVEYIGKKAFASCRNLRSVVLPLSLKEIGDHAFRQCVDLKTVSVSQDVSGKTNVQALKIREGAFFGCSALTSFDLHSIISIDDNGFYKCRALEDIFFFEEVIKITDNAFYGCSSLVIHCPENSYTAKYAVQHNISCQYYALEKNEDIRPTENTISRTEATENIRPMEDTISRTETPSDIELPEIPEDNKCTQKVIASSYKKTTIRTLYPLSQKELSLFIK